MHTLTLSGKTLIVAKFEKNAQNSLKTPILQKHSHDGATYTKKQRIRGATVRVDFQHATSDSAEH